MANLPSSWQGWLKELNELSADAPEWGRVDALTTLIQQLAACEEDRARAPTRPSCGRRFAVLQVGVAGQELAYFEYPEVPNCDVDAYPLSQAPYLVGLLRDLETLLIRHQARRLQSSTTRAGDRERQAELNSLAAEIEASYHNIQAEMASPCRQATPASAQHSESQLADPLPTLSSIAVQDKAPEVVPGEQPLAPQDGYPSAAAIEPDFVGQEDSTTASSTEGSQQDPAMSEVMAGTSEPGREWDAELEDATPATAPVPDAVSATDWIAADDGPVVDAPAGRSEAEPVGMQQAAPMAREQLNRLSSADQLERPFLTRLISDPTRRLPGQKSRRGRRAGHRPAGLAASPISSSISAKWESRVRTQRL